MTETLESKLIAAIKMIEYAILNNQSLISTCLKFKRHEKFLRQLRGSGNAKTEKEINLYNKFITRYNEFLDTKTANESERRVLIDEDNSDLLDKNTQLPDEEQTIKSETSNVIELDCRGKEIIKSAEQMIKAADVDLNLWKLDREVVNKWDVTMKMDDGSIKTAQNFQVKLWLSRIRSKEEQKSWELFLDSISKSAPDLSFLTKRSSINKKHMVELSLPDLHIGKLAHEDEVGENYDTKIAINRYNDSVNKLLEHIIFYKDSIEEILLPIGNDLLQIDRMEGTTTAGTKVDTDSRWQQMFLKAKDLIINTINKLLAIAPVKVVMIQGNHDNQTIFYLGSVLEAYYKNTNDVFIDNTPMQRKYYTYGTNLIGFTHGNEEKHQDLGLIMATEKPELWAKTKYRQIHLGHFHSRKTTKYVDVQEYQGFQIRILPSLSSSDKWHNSKGYMAVKSAVAFLYDKENGMIGEFSHNVI